MRSRFLMLLLGMLLVPAVSRAQIPTADIPGTIQAATEVGNTLNNVKESITQVEQYQKTMSAIGTAKKTVTEFITDQKEKLQEKMEKIQEYKERVEEYKAKAEAYKAEIEDRVNQAKEKIDEVKDTVNEVKDTVTSTVDEAKDKINEVKDQAESIKGQVTGAISAAKDKVAGAKEQMDEACADPESEACKQATEAYTELESAQAEIESACSDPESEACLQAAGVYNQADVAVGAANQVVSAVNAQAGGSVVSSAQATAAVGTAAGIVDALVVKPSRQPITGAVAAASAAKASVVKAASAQPLESAATAKAVSAVSQAKAVGTAAKAVSAQTAPLKAVPAVSRAKAVGTAAKAVSAQTAPLKAVSAVSQAKAVGAAAKAVSAQTAPLKAVSGQNIKQDANTAVEAVSPTAPLKAAPAVQRPTRATFKTSSGYGFAHQTFPLAFASLSLDIGESQGGVTANNVLVVPESISLECNLNFEDAAEDGQMDACLRSINTKALSRVSEDVSKVEIEDAEKALTNGLAEYMAAAYFEAMNIYNESITFKNNVIDPAITAEVSDVQTAWKYALDVSTSMGTRINDLSRLWSRSLATEAYRLYKEKGLQTK